VLEEIDGPAVVGPMTTEKGLGISKVHAIQQNIERNFQVRALTHFSSPKTHTLAKALSRRLSATALLPRLVCSVAAFLVQVPASLIEGLPATVSAMQDWVTAQSRESYVRAKWILGTLVHPPLICVLHSHGVAG
jgi:hypothetical protein